MTNFDDMKLAVESLSGGTNTVKLDNLGMPSILVPFPKLRYADVITGGSQDALPAFIVDGKEIDVIYISKYQNIIVNDRAYSLPFKDPAVSLNFDKALTVCRNKGAGWHLNTNALWAAIALWCKKNGTMPHGNNNFGQDIEFPHEKGTPSRAKDSSSRILATATGSGPVSWYHNYDISGIADLNGNVWEWVAGTRLNDGEIQAIPYGNAMKHDCDMNVASTEWKAVMPDGTFVNPGTVGTLKWDYAASKITLATTLTTQADASRSTTFETLGIASGVTAPMLLKALGLHPDETSYGGDRIIMNNSGEKFSRRGGYWGNTASAGVFSLDFIVPRSYIYTAVGFRAAFCDTLS